MFKDFLHLILGGGAIYVTELTIYLKSFCTTLFLNLMVIQVVVRNAR